MPLPPMRKSVLPESVLPRPISFDDPARMVEILNLDAA